MVHLPADCCNLPAFMADPQQAATPIELSVLAALITIVTGLYLAPAMIAALRESRWTLSIMSLNMFAGWTGAGWLVALIWAWRSGKDGPPVRGAET
jgi:Flp pilus assembly pilin Flp